MVLYAILRLSRQRELDAQAEVLRGSGVAAAGEQGRIGLPVVVEAHGEHTTERIVGRETQLQGIVAAAGTADHRGDVADDGSLTTETEVEAHVEVVVDTHAAF